VGELEDDWSLAFGARPHYLSAGQHPAETCNLTKDNSETGATRPSFEHALAELESIMHELEEGKLGLAEGLARYERGVTLLKQCYELLEHAERRIELLCGVDAEGNPVNQPFEAGEEQTLDEKAQTRSRRRSAAKPAAPPAIEPADSSDEPGSLF
jgi:exodeoxyribonuclease VII small subunit